MREDDFAKDDARFAALAREVFAHQFEHCAPYRRFCEGRGATPATIASWREIPPVPTGAFKETALTSFPIERAVHVFRTSGTSTDTRGALHLDTLDLYEASLVPTFRRHVLPDLGGRKVRFEILAPSPSDAPDSSLSHMFGVLVETLGDARPGYGIAGGEIDADGVIARLRKVTDADAPLVLCATAFALVHLIDALDERGTKLDLPGHARIMETGGFKGRARELSRDVLYAEIERVLGVPDTRIVNQYGMTELGSQFYDSVLREPGTPRRKLGPPWARVRIVDPFTGIDAAPGDVGALVIVDLANTGSVCAIQTADLGRFEAGGFEVLGREPGAEARGCSIAADELLTGAAR
jgi:hypothetical protein